jgi:hypothetical protein
MAPPSTLPRLPAITPDALLTEALTAVAEHLSRVALHLSPHPVLFLPTAEQLRETDLALTLRALLRYAQTGEDAETDDASVAAEYAADRVLTVTTALSGCAWDRVVDVAEDTEPDDREAWGPVARSTEPATVTGLVLLAAWARVQLARETPLSVREVAALAGVSIKTVRHAIDERELRQRAAGVAADEAKRWLGARGVRSRGRALGEISDLPIPPADSIAEARERSGFAPVVAGPGHVHEEYRHTPAEGFVCRCGARRVAVLPDGRKTWE